MSKLSDLGVQGVVRLKAHEAKMGTIWTEPLGWVDAQLLSIIFVGRGLSVEFVLNDWPTHQAVMALWRAAEPADLAEARWVVGCACGQCGKVPTCCRLLLVRKTPPVVVQPLLPPPHPTYQSFVQGFVQAVLSKVAASLGIPASIIPQGKAGGHAS